MGPVSRRYVNESRCLVFSSTARLVFPTCSRLCPERGLVDGSTKLIGDQTADHATIVLPVAGN
jgi:hypothetical protein